MTVDQIEFEIAEPPATPDQSVFVILGETTDGEKVALSIPYPELDQLAAAIAAGVKKFPEGGRTQ